MNTEDLHKIFLTCTGVCTDTRKISQGCIFFALKGENFNGNTFVQTAIANGAAYAVADEDQGQDTRIIYVNDVLKALQNLATFHRRQLNIPVHVIGGSNGKTTTKELTAAILSRKLRTLHTPGNFNNHIGVPLTLLMLRAEHQVAVIELGANHKGENQLLCEIALPGSGLVTNSGKDHLEGFGGIEGVRKANGEVYTNLRKNNALIFLQNGNEELVQMLGNYSNIITYGNVSTSMIRGSASNSNGQLLVELVSPFHARIQTQLAGNYNLENVLAAIATGTHFGVDPADIVKAVEEYAPGNQRSQLIVKGEVTILLDAYNANPSSMEAAILNFGKAYREPRIIALGEMLELGEAAPAEHEAMAALAAAAGTSQLLFVGEHFRQAAAKYGALYFIDSGEATVWLRNNLPLEGSLMIKGSRGTRMEKLLEAFSV